MKAINITIVILFLLFGIAVCGYAQQEPREEHPEKAPQQQAPAQHQEARPQPHAQAHAQPQQHAEPQTHAQPQPQEQPQEHSQPQQHVESHAQPQRAQQSHPPVQTGQPQQTPHRAHPPQSATEHAQQHGYHSENPPPQNAGQPHQTPPNPHAQAPQAQAQHHTTTHRTAPTPQQRQAEQQVWQRHRSEHWNSEHRTWEQRGGYNGYRIPDDRYRLYFGQEHRFRIYSLPFETVESYPRFRYHGYWLQLLDPWPYDWASDWYETDPVYLTFMDGGYYLLDPRYPDYPLAVEIFQ